MADARAKSRKTRKSRSAAKSAKSAKSAKATKAARSAKRANAAKPSKPPSAQRAIPLRKPTPPSLPLSLEAKSPFEMRVNLGKDVPETDVQSALDSGDMGFLHSFTTGATVDGPGVRVVAWTTGCQMRCLYCHNPDTWTLTNGFPITLESAIEQLRKYRHGLKIMSGGFTLSGGEPLMQDRFAVKLFAAAKSLGIHTALDTNGYFGDRLSDAELDFVDL